MQFIVTEEEIARLNEVIGSLAIKQFTNIHGINQKGYRLVIEEIFQEFFKLNLKENEDET
jgi:hypothetical protein|tara:strand:- start:99 stop:278 length:180 start_codon:yes stop_codon:yes gene_type:complete